MRVYGKVYTRFWMKQDTLSWSDSAKLLGLYLLTCQHCNLLGCFRLPLGYIAEDLGWSRRRVSRNLDELNEHGFIERDKAGWTFICNYLKHNPIENINQGKAAIRLLSDVPQEFISHEKLIDALSQYQHKLPEVIQPNQVPQSNSANATTSEPHFNTIDEQNSESTPTPSQEQIPSPTSNQSEAPNNLFNQFWQEQTRKEKKLKAEEEWSRQGLDSDPVKAKEVIDIWIEQKTHRHQYQDRTKTPLPHNWLNNQQWQDEYLTVDEALPFGHSPLDNSFNNAPNNNSFIAQRWSAPIEKEVNSHDRI
ncbi:helix-turn-helix domain-containing protein [Parashewanella curva]|uniref:Helix-turn-helix domain-containing protein n=1 Tax=Parashewanella curva TaxID=2338552 RepID=A0A3L8Q3L1_9GAMM|nr:helix-turn-helix domain-containing protein [Parashewanella curva]RLV61753.1 helix-turn-helix domain-containing protein [Parashewanella curva]